MDGAGRDAVRRLVDDRGTPQEPDVRTARSAGFHSPRVVAAVFAEVHAGRAVVAGDGGGTSCGEATRSTDALRGSGCVFRPAARQWSGGPAAVTGPRPGFPGYSPVGRLPGDGSFRAAY